MESPFNDEIFDHENDEIFQSNQLETDSLWCNSLIDIAEYDNQFFHDDSNFSDILTNNTNYTQSHDTNRFSLDNEDDNNPIISDFELSPVRLKPESTFDSKLYSNIQKQNLKYAYNRSVTSTPKSKSEPFMPDHSSQIKHVNIITESHELNNDLNGCNDDLDNFSTLFSYNQNETELSDNRNSNNNGRKNVFYFNQTNSINRRQNPTIYVTKRNSLSNIRKPLSKIRRQGHSPMYSIYQDSGNRVQTERLKYSLSPSTSSPDSIIDSGLSGNSFQQSFNDDVSTVFNKNNDTPNRLYEVKYKLEKSSRDSLYSSKMSSTRLFQNPIPQTGILILTEEEKRTLLMENYSIPTRLPLTKQEERNLKKVRRKIKNKISAQESRRKKKEYMEALEKKVEIYAHENNDLKKRLESQESLNKSLVSQMRHLQQLLGRAGSNTASTCLMVFLLCFSLIFVGMPNRSQTMRPPESVLVVSNMHKFGYGSIGNIQRTQMTAMQRYFPPDIDAMVLNSNSKLSSTNHNESVYLKTKDKGNEPIESIFSVNNVIITNPRKGILLENSKEEEDDCVQYGPKYQWWQFHSTNSMSNGEQEVSTVSVTGNTVSHVFEDQNSNTSAMEISDRTLIRTSSVTVNKSQPNTDLDWSNRTEDQFQLSFLSIST